MIDEKKVELMTRLSIYEKKEKDKGLAMSKFFERDYVRYNVLKTLVAATVVYWTIVGAYVFISFEVILAKINNMDYFGIMYKILGWYVAFCFVYFVFAYLVYTYRYNSKRKGLAKYNSDLRDLIELSGGPMHHAKLVKNSNINVINDDDVKKKNSASNRSRSTVNRTEIVNNRIKQEEEERNRQIIENSKRLEERRAAQRAMQEEKQRQAEEARLEIRRKRMALEEEQKRQRMQGYSETYRKGDNR
ncbi:MAG: hypothetical protein IJ167_02085 [Lachnospiraceae bacterium]|nr:hypothetical protein [Lachnospiraceae bacterium]